jgi:fumarate reductase subunit C
VGRARGYWLKGYSQEVLFCFFWYQSIDFYTVHAVRGLFPLKFIFRVEFFFIYLFSHLGVVSLLCEWSWATFCSFCRSPILEAHYGAHANAGLAE